MNIATIFKMLYKPILFFLIGVWELFQKTDIWWSSKTSHTKANMRWIFLFCVGLGERIYSEIDHKNENNIRDNRNISDTNISNKEKSDLLQWKYDRLENEIKEAKEAKEIAMKNESDIRKLLKK